MRRFLPPIFKCISILGVLIGFYYAYLVNSWGGHRPLAPDALHPFAYTNHGVYYLSAADLILTRTLLVSALTLAGVGVVGSWLVKRLQR
jgi:hypothetical protein